MFSGRRRAWEGYPIDTAGLQYSHFFTWFDVSGQTIVQKVVRYNKEVWVDDWGAGGGLKMRNKSCKKYTLLLQEDSYLVKVK